jgi:hypothetical protein
MVDGRRLRWDGFLDTLVDRPHVGLGNNTRYKLGHFRDSGTAPWSDAGTASARSQTIGHMEQAQRDGELASGLEKHDCVRLL